METQYTVLDDLSLGDGTVMYGYFARLLLPPILVILCKYYNIIN
jgi:hypothetical protein